MSIEFVYEKKEAIEKIRKVLVEKNLGITKEESVNKGLGIKFTCGDNARFVVYFKSGKSSKIVFEKGADALVDLFRKEKESFDSSDTLQKVKIPVHASFKVSAINIDPIKLEIVKKFDIIEEKQPKDTIVYMLKIKRGSSQLTITQFIKGSILLQGQDSHIVDEVKEIINRFDKISDEENVLTFVPQVEQKKVIELIKQLPEKFKEFCEEAREMLTDEAFDYLYFHDKETFVSALGIFKVVKNSSVEIPLYNPVIYPFSKVFEGFVIKIMMDKEMIDKEKFKTNPEIADIGNCLRKKKFGNYIKDIRRNGSILEKLLSTWESLRCNELHSDPEQNSEITNLSNIKLAENKIGEICSCITDAYRIIIKEGYSETENLENKKANCPENRKTSESSIREIKEIPKLVCHIGTDESGKGDYFGPLVVVGVFVTRDDEIKLEAMGVCDSKNNSDNKNIYIAEEICKILGENKYSIIAIGNLKYNELYENMGQNLNNILGWGHARAIENLLEKNDCADVIADQFGDESVIKKALMAKGKQVNLLQTPKGERDIAVAAASIIARAKFLQELEQLGKDIKAVLPKGANHQVEQVAREIVQAYGKIELKKYAKLHFKTTEKL